MFSEQNDPFSFILDGIADLAIFFLDAKGNVNRWSSSAQKMFGYTTDDIQGKPFTRLYPPPSPKSSSAQEELEMAAAHGRFEDIAWRIRKDQSKFWADCVICPLRNESGQLQGFSVVVRDITERKRAEEVLRQKEEELSQARKLEAVGRLAGGVAHDFNNFITGIVGLADDIRLSMSEQDPRRADLDLIIKTADQARTLTRELLAFGRRQVAAPKVINLNAVLEEKQKILSRLLGADIQLKTELDPEVRKILIDPTQLDQVLINLVMNARDAMPKGGVIRIQTRHLAAPAGTPDAAASGPQALLIISDTGSGMEESVLTHLFEPFFTTKEKGKGTGLGLATVYGIVKQNHGEIFVESRRGEGATFKIRFPEIDAPLQIEPVAGSELSSSPCVETILVVDDTDIVLRVATEALHKSGYRVLSARSGVKALELARQMKEPIHLLLTDIIMPDINGRELAEQLRALHPEAVALFMSGFAEDFVHERGFVKNGVAFIEKPFSNPSLLRKVREVLDRHLSPLAKKA